MYVYTYIYIYAHTHFCLYISLWPMFTYFVDCRWFSHIVNKLPAIFEVPKGSKYIYWLKKDITVIMCGKPNGNHKYHIVRQTRVDPSQFTRLRKRWSSLTHPPHLERCERWSDKHQQLPWYATCNGPDVYSHASRSWCKLQYLGTSFLALHIRWLNNADHACAPDSCGQISTSILTSKLRTWTDLYWFGLI